MRIIPAIDLMNGRCVRLTQGDYERRKVYDYDPVELAKEMESRGIRYLHVVDLEGAKAQGMINYATLEKIVNETGLHVDFGGGLKSDADIERAFSCGAQQVTVGSVAVQHPTRFLNWLNKYGANRVILGADARNRKVLTHGWQESSELDVLEFISNYSKKGVEYVVCTDVARDGMLAGSAHDLYREILGQTQVKLVASGGINSMEDLHQLATLGCEGAIVGKAFYEGRITLKQLAELC